MFMKLESNSNCFLNNIFVHFVEFIRGFWLGWIELFDYMFTIKGTFYLV